MPRKHLLTRDEALNKMPHVLCSHCCACRNACRAGRCSCAALCCAVPCTAPLTAVIFNALCLFSYISYPGIPFFFFLFVGHSGKQHLHLEKSTCWLRKPSICCWLLLLLPEVLCLLSNAVLLTSVLSSASRPHLCT